MKRIIRPDFELRECGPCGHQYVRARRFGPRHEPHCACGATDGFTVFDLLATERTADATFTPTELREVG